MQSLLESMAVLSDPANVHPPITDIDQDWNSLLSLSDTDLDVSRLLIFNKHSSKNNFTKGLMSLHAVMQTHMLAARIYMIALTKS